LAGTQEVSCMKRGFFSGEVACAESLPGLASVHVVPLAELV